MPGRRAERSRGVRDSRLCCRAGVNRTGAAPLVPPAGAFGGTAEHREQPRGRGKPRSPAGQRPGRRSAPALLRAGGTGLGPPRRRGQSPAGLRQRRARRAQPQPKPQRRPHRGEAGRAAPGTRGWPGCPRGAEPPQGWGSLSQRNPCWIGAGAADHRGAAEAAAAFPCGLLARKVSVGVRRSRSRCHCGDSADAVAVPGELCSAGVCANGVSLQSSQARPGGFCLGIARRLRRSCIDLDCPFETVRLVLCLSWRRAVIIHKCKSRALCWAGINLLIGISRKFLSVTTLGFFF